MEGSGRDIPRDRHSELPHSIILDILSLLPTRDAIKTTFLSRRWRNLWTSVPSLNFTTVDVCADDEFEDEKVRSFVNRALLFWKGSKILKFNFDIEFNFDATTLAGDLDLWVRFAVYKNVEDLNIKLLYSDTDSEWEEIVASTYMPQQCLYSCSSITKLSLEGCNLEILRTPTWNHLKSLTKLRGLVSALEPVERLTLSGWCYTVLSDFGNLLRPLPNVKFIDLNFFDDGLEDWWIFFFIFLI